jgi:hypothetical protein
LSFPAGQCLWRHGANEALGRLSGEAADQIVGGVGTTSAALEHPLGVGAELLTSGAVGVQIDALVLDDARPGAVGKVDGVAMPFVPKPGSSFGFGAIGAIGTRSAISGGAT